MAIQQPLRSSESLIRNITVPNVPMLTLHCDASVDKAKSLGGNVLAGPMEIPQVGRFAVLQDPTGAVFAVIKLAQPA